MAWGRPGPCLYPQSLAQWLVSVNEKASTLKNPPSSADVIKVIFDKSQMAWGQTGA